jgi:omega-6 fatty acid desaturase (delta-12 desaturase)
LEDQLELKKAKRSTNEAITNWNFPFSASKLTQVDQPSNEEIRQRLKNWPAMFQEYAKSDTQKAVIQIINSFLPFIALWVLMYWSTFYSYWITMGLAIINAFFLVRIFIIQHDCGHRSFLKSQMANRIIGWICSFFSSIPYQYWANVHGFHHAHNGQLEVRDIGDIKTMTVEEFREASRWQRFGYRIYRMPVITFIIAPLVYLGFYNRVPFVRLNGWKKVYAELHLNNIVLLGVYALLGWLLGWKQFLIVQLSILAFFGIIAMWFFYVQHQHEHTYKQWKDNWDYLLSAIRGSTYYKLPKLMQWFTGNIGYHHIHHLNAKIPNYNLERCAKDHSFLEKYITTVTFWQSLRLMAHKLWCEDEQTMISFTEFYRREKGQYNRAA